MVDEVREMSLREVGVRSLGSYERGSRNRARDGSQDSREEEARQRRRREQERRRRAEGHNTLVGEGGSSSGATESRSQTRQVEHQSSLRSLLSSSDIDSSEIEQEILRQIMDEGLLEGIDLDNIDVSQEDELSERIADAYRRRHVRGSRSPNTQIQEPNDANAQTRRTDQARSPRHHHQRSTSAADQAPRSSHPPISRPYLLEAYPIAQGQRRRTSSEHHRQTSPAHVSSSSRGSSETQRQAARSATDLSARPRTTAVPRPLPPELSLRARRTTDSEHPRPRAAPQISPIQIARPTGSTGTGIDRQAHSIPIEAPVASPVGLALTPRSSNPVVVDNAPDISSSASRPSPLIATNARPQLQRYHEPSIGCDRCGTSNLEYELHQNCSTCRGGTYNLCLRCYRLGRGCLYWYGFGTAALERYKRQAPPAGYPPNHPLPHTLTGHRFVRPKSDVSRQHAQGNDTSHRMTSEDPAQRLQSGAFCSGCTTFANDCFWKCSSCNDGEWGFCNLCVNQGKCCTHPLLAVAHSSSMNSERQAQSTTPRSGMSFAPMTAPKSASGGFRPTELTMSGGQFIPLSFSTDCDICTHPIQPSNNRFHCPQCNNGDYDICTACYLKLVATGRISKDNGDKGWRRCLKGHRMIVFGFEDSTAGQKRTIVKDLVGGHALKDEVDALQNKDQEWSWVDEQQKQIRTVTKKVASGGGAQSIGSATPALRPLLGRYPPDGGVGIRAVARWSYWPQEGMKDELAFPKGAEIREADDINGDWFWGCYAGMRGLFPGNYAGVLHVVTIQRRSDV